MNLDLFDTGDQQPQKITLPDAELLYWPNFFCTSQAQYWYEKLINSIQWQEKVVHMYGRDVLVPRLSAWYADLGKDYTYSEALHIPLEWTEELSTIKNDVQNRTNAQFNSVLCNLYRDGKDSVAWHSDDEPELGIEPVIASVSFGETRAFKMRHKKDTQQNFSLELSSGSCLIMRGATQACWEHQIAKTTRVLTPRINLTFRLIS